MPFFKGAKVSLVPSQFAEFFSLCVAHVREHLHGRFPREFAAESKAHVLPRRYAEAVYGGIVVKRGVLGEKDLEDVTHVPPTAL